MVGVDRSVRSYVCAGLLSTRGSATGSLQSYFQHFHVEPPEQCSMMLPKLPLVPLTQFSSLENLKSGWTVEISFHDCFCFLSVFCLIDFPVLFRISTALAKPICIFSIRLVPCSPRAFSSSAIVLS